MSAPRTKRQFTGSAADPAQRQITSFFTSGSKSTITSSSSNTKSITLTQQQPPLPANVQASLLNVGMRVRKSVPEGYKTGSAYSGFKLFTDPTEVSAAAAVPSLPSLTASQRELLPFCGINKVGGLSSQPDFDPVPGLDDVPALSSSQDTVSQPSLSQTTPNARKRFYVEEEPADVPVDHCLKVRQDWLDGEISPRTMAPASWGNARPMAVLKKRGTGGRKSSAAAAEGQENVVMDDFEDAEFLDGQILSEMEMDA